MNIHKILLKVNIGDAISVSFVTEGTVSMVWKVVLWNGTALAVRIVGNDQLDQFLKEMNIMNHVRSRGITSPKVYSVDQIDGYVVMVMDWVDGETVFTHLLERGHHAHEIGFQFGEMQAELHGISYTGLDYFHKEDWLTPVTNAEKEIISKLNPDTPVLLHLDYHPLNVMLNSPGIIDWTNCSIGDYKFDIARTLSIMEIKGTQYFNEEILASFIAGWKDGYESKRGRIGELNLYIQWAGERMKRDLKGQLDEEGNRMIDEWIQKRLKGERRGEISAL